MVVEPGTVDDVDAVADLWVRLAGEQTQYGSHVRPEENRTAIRDELARKATNDRLLVAREDTIVGFATFAVERGTFDLDARKGVVENLYVVPERRSEGIGSALLSGAEDWLAAHGVDVVALEALADNLEARRFYRRHGYDTHRVALEKPVRNDNHSKEGG